jgi:hypothetical protein
MSRACRILFYSVVTIMTIFWSVLITLCVRSCIEEDDLALDISSQTIAFRLHGTSAQGGVSLSCFLYDLSPEPFRASGLAQIYRSLPIFVWRHEPVHPWIRSDKLRYFRFERRATPLSADGMHPPTWTVQINVPHWALLLPLCPGPYLAFRNFNKFKRSRRLKQCHCPECGYDLRATPEKGGALLDRCPECGYEAARAE